MVGKWLQVDEITRNDGELRRRNEGIKREIWEGEC